ncbi:cuticle protein CP1499-like [Procambarus clarkii]|uniref:cuticle protein CP1499-like n=1 Tax=Procambarus clarkii TaxID=6728 RepID=UPI0037433D30
MRSLVVLAVIGVCSAGYQAYNPGYQAYNPGFGYGVQPKYVGPVAATIPAGIGGKVIPVSDTYEVAAAKDDFYKAYDKQLKTLDIIRSSRYGTPGYAPALPVYKAPVAPFFASTGSYGAPIGSYGYHGPPTQVHDTPEVVAAKAEFFKLYNKQAAAAAAAPDLYTYH